jgi:manganese/iron transport system permease protein
VLDPFQLPFMQRAALEIALLAPIAGVLGAQVVLRRLAFFTHSVGAATFPGLVVAASTAVPPALAAFGAGGVFAGLLAWTDRRAGLTRDAATALLLVAALAIGVILASDVFESGAGVDQLLFGSLLAIGDGELALTAGALLLALAAAAGFRRTWIASGFDPELATSQRLRTGWAELALVTALAVAVIASLDAVGSLLVSAIFVLPAASVRVLAPSVRSLEAGAAALALTQGLAGLLLAYELDAPPGATIAVIGGAVFALCVAYRTLTGSRSPAEATA